MKKPKFGPLILAIVLFIVLLNIPSTWLMPLINDAKLKSNASDLSEVMFQGHATQRKMLADSKYIPIYGSSELSRFREFHPTNFFKNEDNGYTPYLIGTGGTQSLIHLLNFVSVKDVLKDRKIVFIISPTWFRPEGMTEDRYIDNYSKINAYQFIFVDIDPEIKKATAKRMLEYKFIQDDYVLSTLLKEIVDPSDVGAIKQAFCSRAARTYLKFANKADIISSAVDLSESTKRTFTPFDKNITVEEMLKQSNEIGLETSNDNPFYMDNGIYQEKKGYFEDHKDYMKDTDYKNSSEYGDFQMMLKFLKENNVEVLLISTPLNGYAYDYQGFSKEKRFEHYDRVKNIVAEYGYEFVDLSSHEYDKYFFTDSLHLDNTGWVYVDQAISKFLGKEIREK